MKKREIVNLIELNKKILDGKRYKKIIIPKFDELNAELDILKNEVEEGIKASKEAKKKIKEYNCDHSVRFSYPGGWGYMRSDECIFCGKQFDADNIVHSNTIYDDVNRNRYCARFTTNYFYDPDFYCDNAYNEHEIYDLILKVIDNIDDEEEIDFVQLLKKIDLKDCKIDERKKEKIHYILIISGSNKFTISESGYITSNRIPIITNFASLFASIPGIRVELIDNEDVFKNKNFTDRFDINKVGNMRCVSYETIEELKEEIHKEKNVPFDIIIDMSSLYDYKISDGKIISEKIDIDFKEIFPDSYIIKIDDFGVKEQKEILEILKDKLLSYNEAYGYIKPKKNYSMYRREDEDFYKIDNDNLATCDVNDVYKGLRRVLVKR